MRNTEQRYGKSENSALFVRRKTWLCLKKVAWGKPFDALYIGWNPSANARLLLRLPDAASVGCELHARQPLALAVVNIRACRRRFLFACTRHNLLCLVFGKKFNTMSALFAHQPFILSQKIDSREGCCWCKKRLVHEYSKMNFYLKELPFAPCFRPILAKCGAIWC